MSALDGGPPGLAEAEAIAATLVELGYSARAYPRVSNWGYQVVVTGKLRDHGRRAIAEGTGRPGTGRDGRG
jgi:hypothetical protein